MRDGTQAPNSKEVRLSTPSRTVSGSSPALTTKGRKCEGPECTQKIHIDGLERQHIQSGGGMVDANYAGELGWGAV